MFNATNEGIARIGASVPRVEDPELLAGLAIFIADLAVPDAIELVFVRSVLGHALIKVDVSGVEPSPDLFGVWTGEDLASEVSPLGGDSPDPSWQGTDFWPLAVDRVRFAGEAVAVVAGRDRATAEDAAGAIAIEYEPLPPVASIDMALADDAPILHDGWHSNLYATLRHRSGDLARAFEQAHGVVEIEVSTDRQLGAPMELRGCVAVPSSDGLLLWTSTQVPQVVRAGLAAALRLSPERIEVATPAVGGGFGVKQQLFPEEVVTAYVALATGRPVRWIEDSSEHLLASVHAREHRHRLEAAFDPDGRVLAVRGELAFDCGAYSMYPSSAALDGEIALNSLTGPYALPELDLSVLSVATNKCPVGPYRGVGRPSACLAIERVMDAVAGATGIEPLEVRRRNLVPSPLEDGNLDADDLSIPRATQVLDRLLHSTAYTELHALRDKGRAEGRLRGLGLAIYVESAGFVSAKRFIDRGVPLEFDREELRIAVTPDGVTRLVLPTHSHGQGHRTMVGQIVSDVLGIRMETIEVLFGDSRISPAGLGTFNSRSAIVSGEGAYLLALELRRQAVAIAGVLAGDRATVAWVEGRITISRDEEVVRALDLYELARWMAEEGDMLASAEVPAELAARSEFVERAGGPSKSFGAHLVLLDVDPGQLRIRVLRYVVAEESGVVINPTMAEGQIHGGVAQGLGGALLESFGYDGEAQPISAAYADYAIPTALDLPSITVLHDSAERPQGGGLGVKGMAEGSVIPTAAAVAAAVEDALGISGTNSVRELPLTPSRILPLLEARGAH